ncbi:hypothetical protein Y1Q_0010448 [Alligator mississippiensis]|uniref:Uncharacterized protein n=1 Tax=Alligator mississippiensis TaxID=8496 RepID=A0A151P7B2_ALLMI|nr:hypothetical protein Y1Q_0010448 [Alligator mississippiensis]
MRFFPGKWLPRRMDWAISCLQVIQRPTQWQRKREGLTVITVFNQRHHAGVRMKATAPLFHLNLLTGQVLEQFSSHRPFIFGRVNISQEEFRKHFDPNHFESKTYLLCEIKRDKDSTSTKYCYKNLDFLHAEVKFLNDGIYYHDHEENREGLRTLKQSGVNIQVMEKSDYEYCWETFVRNKEGTYDFPTKEVCWSEELERI